MDSFFGIILGVSFFVIFFLPFFILLKKRLSEGVLKYAWRNECFRTNEPMVIGSYNREGWGDFWQGGMSDLLIYKKKIDATQMEELGKENSNNSENINTSELIARYKMNNISSESIVDSSGNENNGKGVNISKLNGPNDLSSGAKFDGKRSHILLSHEPFDFSIKDTFSCSVWIKPEVFNGYRSIIAKVKGCKQPDDNPHLSTRKCPWVSGTGYPNQGDWEGIAFFLDEKEQDYRYIRIQFGDMEGPRIIDVVTKNPILKKNEWQQVGFTYDGKGSAEGVKLFLNGKSVPVEIYFDSPYKVDEKLRRLSKLIVTKSNLILIGSFVGNIALGLGLEGIWSALHS